MADASAGIDVVVAEAGTHQLLHEVSFFIGAARGRDAADRMLAIAFLQAPEFAGYVGECHFPAHNLPWVGDFRADHRRGDAVRVRGIANREAALHAGVSVLRVAVLVRPHAHVFFALHLGAEAAADAAVGTGSNHAVLGLTLVDQRFFRQRGGGAGLHAGAAGDAFGIEEAVVLAGGYLGVEAPALDG